MDSFDVAPKLVGSCKTLEVREVGIDIARFGGGGGGTRRDCGRGGVCPAAAACVGVGIGTWAGDVGRGNGPGNGGAICLGGTAGVGWEGVCTWAVGGRLAACPSEEVASCPGGVEAGC